MGIINNFLIVELDLRYRWYALRADDSAPERN